MRKKTIIIIAILLVFLVACNKENMTNTPTPLVEDKIEKITQIAAEAVKKSSYYDESDGKVGGIVIDLSKATSTDLCQKNDEMCYLIRFGCEVRTGMVLELIGVYISKDNYEVVDISQFK